MGLTGLGMVGSTKGGTYLLTMAFPGMEAPGVHEGIEALTPARQTELEAAFARMEQRLPGDPCEICELQRRWAEEDLRRAEAG